MAAREMVDADLHLARAFVDRTADSGIVVAGWTQRQTDELRTFGVLSDGPRPFLSPLGLRARQLLIYALRKDRT